MKGLTILEWTIKRLIEAIYLQNMIIVEIRIVVSRFLEKHILNASKLK